MIGHYFKSLDEKNRSIVPSKFRKELGDTLYITVGPDKVLELRDEQSFNIYKDKLLSSNWLNPNARKFARLTLGNSADVKPDSQGRILFPETLLKQALITKEIVFVGVGNKVEIWDKQRYEDFQADFADAKSIDDLAAELLKDGVEL